MTERDQRRILVVDDGDDATAVADAIATVGFTVNRTLSGLAGLVAVEEDEPELIILLWTMPFIHGHVFLAALRTGLTTPPPVLVLVGPGDDPLPVVEAGAQAVLSKSADGETLVREVKRLLR